MKNRIFPTIAVPAVGLFSEYNLEESLNLFLEEGYCPLNVYNREEYFPPLSVLFPVSLELTRYFFALEFDH